MGPSRVLWAFEATSFHFKADGSASNKISGNTPDIERFHSCLQSYRDVVDIAGRDCAHVHLRMSSHGKEKKIHQSR